MSRFVLQWILRLYPKRFRESLAPELLTQYDARSGDRSWGFGVRTCFDALLQIPRVWIDEWRNPVTPSVATREAPWMGWLYEGRLALRNLFQRQWTFTALCVLTLGLGLGATTAIFSVVNGVLLAPLPYGEPDRIVRIYETELHEGSGSFRGPLFSELRERLESFEVIAAFYDLQAEGVDLTDGARAQRIDILRVGSGYFEALGTAPLVGRTFRRAEEVPEDAATRDPDQWAMVRGSARPVAILSHDFWQRHYGGSRDVLGRKLELDQESHEVIGVMPPHLGGHLGGAPDVWLPLDLAPGGLNVWYNNYLSVVARLAPGTTVTAAQAELDRTAATYRSEGGRHRKLTFDMVAVDELVAGPSRALLGILLAAVLAMLAIACINVANLFLTRGLGRQREFAVRAALGAARRRLFAQTLIEGAWIALAGGFLGLAVAWFAIRLLLWSRPEALPRFDALGLHTPVLGFCALAVVSTIFVFGLVPALRASRADAAGAFGERSSVAATSRRHGTFRDYAVVLQVAVASILLAAAGMLARSFLSLQHTDMGFVPQDVLSFKLRLPDYAYDDPVRRVDFYRDFFSRLEGRGEIESAGAMSKLPGDGHRNRWGARRWRGEEADWIQAEIRCIAGDAFQTLSIPLLQGRGLEADDVEGSERVVWINQALADRYFDGEVPLGHGIGFGEQERRTIVGVVGNTRQDPFEEAVPKVYVPQPQFANDRNWDLSFAVARAGDGDSSWQQVRNAVDAVLLDLDPRLALYDVRPFVDVVEKPMARHSFGAQLMLVFSLASLLLAAVGLFGALAYALDQRRGEIGVRMALGASRKAVLSSVFRHGLRLCVLGVGLGAGGAWLMGRWLESLLHGVRPGDPLSFVLAATILIAVGGLAAAEPARRASRLDPAEILRES
ncbi:MAG: ABC transporter permease [Thermoanaerobaculia bacterium]|nr:ABC transporter permease [Thermoanaerobaculia bacterium]